MLSLGLGVTGLRRRHRAAAITGTGPRLGALQQGQALSASVVWGSYAPSGHSVQREMQKEGGAWASYVGTVTLVQGEVWRLREVVSLGGVSRTFSSETQVVSALDVPEPSSGLSAHVKVLFIGDSTTAGVGADPSGLTDVNGSYAFSVPSQVAVALQAAGIPASTHSYLGDNGVGAATLPLYRSDISVGGALTLSSRSPTIGGSLFRPSTSTSLSMTTNSAIDCVEIGFPKGSGFGTLAVLIDDAPHVSYAQASTSDSYQLETITGLDLAPHKITLTAASGAAHGPAYLLAYDSTTPQVLILNAGVRNRTSSAAIDATYPTSARPSLSAIAPDIVVIDLGINDYRQGGSSVASLTANLQSLITEAHSIGAQVILVVPSPIASYYSGSTSWSQSLVLTLYQTLAANNPGVILIDTPKSYHEAGLTAANPATWAALNSAGLAYDGLHMKAEVYAVEAAKIAEVIADLLLG